MSSFNYWISLGYAPNVALKLSKSKNQRKLIAKDQAYRAQVSAQQASQPKAPEAPKPTKIRGPEYETRDRSTSVKVKSKGSARRRRATQRGTSQLRIPLNTGQQKTGGLNV